MTASEWEPLALAVAPNGARKTKADHPALPISPADLAYEAAVCREAGAAMIHLHVRDADDRHTLDADAYKAAIAAIKGAVGDAMVIQVTSEAVGMYQPTEQMQMVRLVRPEAVSLAVREIIADDAAEPAAANFLTWMYAERIQAQYILYSAEDVQRFQDLRRRGVIPGDAPFVLYVLGRYTKGQISEPSDLLEFLAVDGSRDVPWSMCAFGPKESACGLAAAALGGHARLGFENNTALADGSQAANNAALIAQLVEGVRVLGRPLADADTVRILGR